VYWQSWLGAFLIAIVLFGHGGVLGACKRLSWYWRERRPKPAVQP
jgi:hypothetical protein